MTNTTITIDNNNGVYVVYTNDGSDIKVFAKYADAKRFVITHKETEYNIWQRPIE